MFQILVTIARNFREAREMRDEKGRLEGLHDKHMEEAEKVHYVQQPGPWGRTGEKLPNRNECKYDSLGENGRCIYNIQAR